MECYSSSPSPEEYLTIGLFESNINTKKTSFALSGDCVYECICDNGQNDNNRITSAWFNHQ